MMFSFNKDQNEGTAQAIPFFFVCFVFAYRKLNACVQNIHVFRFVLRECAVLQCVTNFREQRIIKPEIVDHAKAHGKHFACFKQVADVGAGMPPAGRAAALRVDWRKVVFILFVVDVADALFGEQMPVAGIAAGHDAVE